MRHPRLRTLHLRSTRQHWSKAEIPFFRIVPSRRCMGQHPQEPEDFLMDTYK
jgi:hypothetical protein